MPIFKMKDNPESIKAAQEYLKRSGLDTLKNVEDLTIAKDIASDMSTVNLFSTSVVLGELSKEDFYKIRLLDALTLQNNLIIRQLQRLNENIEHLNSSNTSAPASDTIPTHEARNEECINASDREKDLLRRLGYI